uniref:ATP-dependent zinc metalloprotease FtsH n=1 Tax=Proboscia sp. TaxID=1923967 RepID=A0A2U9NM06_9STRA|nr:putative plastid division protein [Proboscia sp.]
MWKKLLKNVLIGFIIGSNLSFGFKAVTGNLNTVASIYNTTPKSTQNTVSSKMTYGRFLEYLEMDWVKQVDLYDNGRNAVVKASSPELGNRPQTIRVEIPVGASQLISKLKEYNIDFDAHPVKTSTISAVIATNLIIPLIFIGSLAYFLQNSDDLLNNDGQSPLNFGQQANSYKKRPDPAISFKNIAGIDEAKAEIEEVVSFLKQPDKYTIVGAKIPKGILLVGPPGTGKTLLAKAIANEADVSFFSAAGSEFVEMYVGVGASRVRELFEEASSKSPSIVFIDEIDAIGRERGNGVGSGNDEREQTLNQLLTEMDGFKENKNIIVIGATNRVDILDAALLRPGRFDRQITVNLPDRRARNAILEVHAKKKKFNEDVSLVELAGKTSGFSGADLSNLLNEAAILATRYKKQVISQNEVDEAVDRITGGIAGVPLEENKNKQLIAYQEVGHAIAATVLKSHNAVEKITITPRGKSKGLTWFTAEEDQNLISRAELLARIIMMLGGRAAEQVVFGDTEITTGVSDDLQKATNLARQMVTQFGMSNIGPIALEDENAEPLFIGNSITLNGNEVSNIADRVDEQVLKIINYCEEKAVQIILDNRVVIDLVVDKLLEKETMEGSEFRELVSSYTILPEAEVYISKFK